MHNIGDLIKAIEAGMYASKEQELRMPQANQSNQALQNRPQFHFTETFLSKNQINKNRSTDAKQVNDIDVQNWSQADMYARFREAQGEGAPYVIQTHGRNTSSYSNSAFFAGGHSKSSS